MLFIEHKEKPKRKRLTFLYFAEKEGVSYDTDGGVSTQMLLCLA